MDFSILYVFSPIAHSLHPTAPGLFIGSVQEFVFSKYYKQASFIGRCPFNVNTILLSCMPYTDTNAHYSNTSTDR